MKTIWKFQFERLGRFVVGMPVGAQVLCVQVQREAVCLWALVDPERDIEQRRFRVYGTGHSVERDGLYVGTFQLDGGTLVFHVFEEP